MIFDELTKLISRKCKNYGTTLKDVWKAYYKEYESTISIISSLYMT